MDNFGAVLLTLALTFTVTFVTSTQSDEEETFSGSPYISTAMRLSVPGIGREPTEEEIMKDVDALEPLKFDPSFDYQQNRQSVWPLKRQGLDRNGFRSGLRTEQRPKRYYEFLGKRDENTQTQDQRRLEMVKRWNEFVGKRGDAWVASPTLVAKRYVEFIGKREPLRYSSPEKKYAEFLG